MLAGLAGSKLECDWPIGHHLFVPKGTLIFVITLYVAVEGMIFRFRGSKQQSECDKRHAAFRHQIRSIEVDAQSGSMLLTTHIVGQT